MNYPRMLYLCSGVDEEEEIKYQIPDRRAEGNTGFHSGSVYGSELGACDYRLRPKSVTAAGTNFGWSRQ